MVTAPDGRFEMSIPAPGPRRVTVTLPGFQPAEATIDASASGEGSAERELRITLFPRAFAETVSVTASRGSERIEGAAPVSVVTQTDLQLAASPALDDALRERAWVHPVSPHLVADGEPDGAGRVTARALGLRREPCAGAR